MIKNTLLFSIVKCCLICTLASFYHLSYSQDIDNEEKTDRLKEKHAIEYLNFVENFSPVYVGRTPVNMHESFIFAEYDLLYDGALYPKQKIFYDNHIDDILIQTPTKQYVTLDPGKFQYASNATSKMVFLDKNPFRGFPGIGYYHLIYASNENMVLKRHLKTLQPIWKNGKQRYGLEDVIRYYIVKDERFYHVKDNKSVLNILKDKRNELDAFIRKYNLNVKNEPERSLASITSYYESLTQK